MDWLQILGVAATLVVLGLFVWAQRNEAGANARASRLTAIGLFLLASAYGTATIVSHAPEPFNWDEVDYVNASKLGVAANWTEHGSLSLRDFYKIGKVKGSGNVKAIQQLGRQLPPEATDPFALRHFHPPLATYFWSVWGKLGQSNSLWHLSMLFVLGLSLFAMAFMPRTKPVFGLCAACVAFTAPAVITGYGLLSFHEWHTPALLAFTGILFVAAESSRAEREIALGIAGAFLLLTLEMGAIVLGLALIAIVASGRWRQFLRVPPLARIIGSFLVSLLVLWPGFFLKGGTFKAMAMYAYRLFVKQGEEYQTVTPTQFWSQLVVHSPLLILWCAGGVVLTVHGVLTRRLPRTYLVPLVIGGGYALFMTPFALRDAYMAPALVVLAANTAIAMAGLANAEDSRASRTISWLAIGSAGLAVVLGFLSTSFVHQWRTSEQHAAQADAEATRIRALLPKDRPVLAVGGHMLGYYAPGNYSIMRADAFGAPVQLQERVDYAAIPATADLDRGRFGAVVLWRSSNVAPNVLNDLFKRGYRINRLQFFDVALPPDSHRGPAAPAG